LFLNLINPPEKACCPYSIFDLLLLWCFSPGCEHPHAKNLALSFDFWTCSESYDSDTSTNKEVDRFIINKSKARRAQHSYQQSSRLSLEKKKKKKKEKTAV